MMVEFTGVTTRSCGASSKKHIRHCEDCEEESSSRNVTHNTVCLVKVQ